LLEGLHADSCELVDLQITKTLEGHRKRHFFELIRDVMDNHSWGDGGILSGGGKKRETTL